MGIGIICEVGGSHRVSSKLAPIHDLKSPDGGGGVCIVDDDLANSRAIARPGDENLIDLAILQAHTRSTAQCLSATTHMRGTAGPGCVNMMAEQVRWLALGQLRP